ncbi:hypothetical protein PGB90_007936 [Kerria lacca]
MLVQHHWKTTPGGNQSSATKGTVPMDSGGHQYATTKVQERILITSNNSAKWQGNGNCEE